MNNESEMLFNIEFNDITLFEGSCNYEKICLIMKEEEIASKKWMLETDATAVCYYLDKGQQMVVSEANLKLQFFNDGNVKITEYMTSSLDPLYSPDIRSLKSFIIEKGWKKLEPHIFLIDRNIILWKTLWETFVVDSDYLEKRFGVREEFKEEEENE